MDKEQGDGRQVVLSVVIVEYHSIEEVQTCIASLEKCVGVTHEIIVSSNSCYDEKERARLAADNGLVSWVFNEQNGGFAYAMNEGLKRAKGAYLAIMNADCIFETPLDDMITFMEHHSEVGAVGPQMHDAQGNIQDTARPYVTLPRFIWRQARRVVGHQTSILNAKMDYGQIQTVDWVIGAFIMVSRQAYQETGGLDERFFMYAEDLDWCTRIRMNGWEVVYYPKSLVTYKGTRRARSNKKYAKIFLKSHVAYWKKFGFFYGYPPRKKILFHHDVKEYDHQ